MPQIIILCINCMDIIIVRICSAAENKVKTLFLHMKNQLADLTSLQGRVPLSLSRFLWLSPTHPLPESKFIKNRQMTDVQKPLLLGGGLSVMPFKLECLDNAKLQYGNLKPFSSAA